ncbi:MAG: GNAT family N-acetyltransferase [Phyllobacteriaceae bacterium]|nr:GNAT family N-acetyltransferase [Phyllobacteriaceae bacterium]
MAEFLIRRAALSDLPRILALLTDDDLGKLVDTRVNEEHRAAFHAIDGDADQFLAVGEVEGVVVATLQLTFVPGLSRNGMRRALVEAVRVDRSVRGRGLGAQMMRWALEKSAKEGCGMVQLLMDKRRIDSGRFYESFGFTRSHDGFRMYF